jgi:hypothetical protein
MKLKINIFLGVLFILCVSTQNVFAFSGAGDGLSTETAFIITTCEQLQEMNDDLDAYYKLGNTIDCAASATWNANEEEWVDGIVGGTLIDDPYVGVINNGYYGFEPIGQVAVMGESQGFTGTLDGQNYTISNLWIFRKDLAHNGLIGYATGATIKNITLSNAQIVGGSSTGGFLGYGSGVGLEDLTNTNGMVRAYLAYRGGGIAGQLDNSSTATLLTVTDGTVHGSGNIIGGLIGSLTNTSTVTNSSASADVDGGEYVGGAFGEIFDSNVDNVDATGNVESNDGDDIPSGYNFSKNGFYTGGFVGRIYNSVVENSTASGLVTAEDNYAGGFAGEIFSQSQIVDSSATGNVSGNEYIGGFAGNIDNSTIIDSTATGAVSALGSYVGGFSGISLCGSSFLRVSASGDVQADNSYVGGFTGYDACEGPGSTFTQASAHGNVSGNNVVGGFMGYGNVSTFINVYSSGSVIGNDQVGSFASDITNSSLDNVYARGSVSLYGEGTLLGGFAKDAPNTTITDSFWDAESIGQVEACQTGECSGLTALTTFEALTSSTYTDAGWDFEGIWEMNSDNYGYPHFIWEYFEYEEPELLSLSATEITQTSALLRGRVVSGEFIQFGLGFAFAPVPLDEAEESLQLIGPSDEFDEESGDYIKDLGLYFDTENPLTCGTTYYYTAIGFQGLGMFDDLIAAENELSFTTLSCDSEEVEEPRSPRRSGSRRQVTSSNSPFSQNSTGVSDSVGNTTMPQSNQSLPTSIEGLRTLLVQLQAQLAQLLSNTPASNNNPITRDLQLNDQGEDVRTLQQQLISKGYSISAGATGFFGTQTRDALIKFQQDNNITPAQGYFGLVTRGVINR